MLILWRSGIETDSSRNFCKLKSLVYSSLQPRKQKKYFPSDFLHYEVALCHSRCGWPRRSITRPPARRGPSQTLILLVKLRTVHLIEQLFLLCRRRNALGYSILLFILGSRPLQPGLVPVQQWRRLLLRDGLCSLPLHDDTAGLVERHIYANLLFY